MGVDLIDRSVTLVGRYSACPTLRVSPLLQQGRRSESIAVAHPGPAPPAGVVGRAVHDCAGQRHERVFGRRPRPQRAGREPPPHGEHAFRGDLPAYPTGAGPNERALRRRVRLAGSRRPSGRENLADRRG